MSKCHLCEKCVRVPRDIRHKLNLYRTDCRRAVKGKEYWSEHIRSLGVYEDPVDGCIRVRRPGDARRPRLKAQDILFETSVNDDSRMKEYTEPGDDGQSARTDKVEEELKDDGSDDKRKKSGRVMKEVDNRIDIESNATSAASQGDDDELPQGRSADEEVNAQSVPEDLSLDTVAVAVER
jgi:hypothetical protein